MEMSGEFTSLEAEDMAAPFNINIHMEKDKYENQNERQGRWDCIEPQPEGC